MLLLGALALVVWLEARPPAGPPPALPAEVTTPQRLGPDPALAPPPQVPPAPDPPPSRGFDGYDDAVYDAPEAPVRFVLDSHHRFTVEDSPSLGEAPVPFEVVAWPVLRAFGEFDPYPSHRASASELKKLEHRKLAKQRGVFLFTRTARGLDVRLARPRDTWPGGTTWVLAVAERDSKRTLDALRLRVAGAEMSITGGLRTLDGLDRFAVGSLRGAAQWSLTVTAREGSGKALVPAILYAAPEREDAPPATLDGVPLSQNMAVVKPGTYRLSGASSLWMSLPSYTGLETVSLDVELSRGSN
jgi:hypothetical protein